MERFFVKTDIINSRNKSKRGLVSEQKTKLKASDFVHLHNHTQYSLLDGLTKIKPLVDFTKDNGMEAVAMTDHGTLSGAIDFYKEAHAAGVKPLIGIETYVAARKHTDKDPGIDKQRYHLVIIAMNNQGYQNLMRLSTIANLDGFYYHPRIDHDLLEKYNEGLIVTSACMSGEVGSALKDNNFKKAEEVAKWYKSVFGDRYYLEVQDHGHELNPLHSTEQENINKQVLKLGKKLDIPVVVTCDAHYLKHEDQDAHEILLCVGTGSYLSDEKRMTLKDFPLHVEEPQNIIDRWGGDYPEVILNTKQVADRCNVEIELGKILIPKFPVPEGETENSYLTKLVYQGLAVAYLSDQTKNTDIEEIKKLLPQAVADRAKFELEIIDSMGFNGYFLIIWDFIKWGKGQGIVFGPGRGSAAGSIISYALRITELDPLKYDLLFERFLNPDRISMPDIDIDIQDTRRDEVIKYCVEKYGSDRVANIVTFGRMAARAAVRDVARVLQVPYADADRIAKLIPPPVQGRHIPLEQSLVKDNELKAEYQKNSQARQVFDMAVRLEGTIRSHGVHAAGVVIAPDEIVKFVPLEMAQKGVVSTQYPMGPIEELGLLKMDFLGLSNLTIIKNALRIIKKVYKVDIDVGSLPLDDQKSYELLGRGDTTGVFQLESAGMKRYLKDLKPSEFEDIVAMVALYRPGPMQFIDDFIGRKHGRKKIEYPHPSMENSLKNTYGILVYQEQVMQISKEVCGFSGGEADTLRKAIGKKNADLLAKMKDKMIEGGQKHSGIDREVMELFWKQLEDFAAYCFNKSHAACYGLVAYWTAYLKAHYPAAFMAALMTSDFDDTDRLAIEISECKHMGITVLAPDVNQSFHEFAVVPHAENQEQEIRFGLDAIKNVGQGAVAEIIRAREEQGEFTSIVDFITKVNGRLVNRKVWESLIKSGALDRFGERGALLEILDDILVTGAKLNKNIEEGQTDLFGSDESAVVPKLDIAIPEKSVLYSEHEYLQWERQLLGLYLSSHPLEAFDAILSEKAVPLGEVTPENDKKQAIVGGTIADIRQITTKNGQAMAFVKLEDIAGDERELVVFPTVFKTSSDIWQRDKVILASGKINGTDKLGQAQTEAKLLVDSAQIISLEDAKNYQPIGERLKIKAPKKSKKTESKKNNFVAASVDGTNSYQSANNQKNRKLFIRLISSDNNEVLQNLKKTMDSFPGDIEAVLVIGDSKQAIKLPMKVDYTDELKSQLVDLVGTGNIKLS
jgi:DNA polymerase-3 subunit alpha